MSELINKASVDGFTFQPVTPADLVLAISHFSSQARGEDGIPRSVICKALPTVLPYLTVAVNTSLARGFFPESWKGANVLPLKKENAPGSVSDFQPIVLLTFLSKVLEKLAHDQLAEYLN